MSNPLDDVFSLGNRKPPAAPVRPPGEPQRPNLDFPGKRPLRAHTEKAKQPEVADVEWDAKPVIKVLNGKETEFFFVGHLAAALGRTPVTIRSWEAKGWLPLSKYRTPSPGRGTIPDAAVMGKRLYTRQQIEVVIAAANAHGVMTSMGRDADWRSFTRAVLAGWKTTS